MTARSCAPQRDEAAGSGATALLLVDFINLLEFEHGEALRPAAEQAAARTAALKRSLKADGIQTIYANDNFGHWRSDFSHLVARCAAPDCRGRELARRLKPEPDDLSVLKPRHSAFYGTPLEFLLAELGVSRLVIAGLVTEMCVLFTAHDAYLRKFELWIPEDCVASVEEVHRRRTIDHLRDVLGADTRASGEAAVAQRDFATAGP